MIKKIIDKLNDIQYTNGSFSQEGEDLIIDRLLEGQAKGFYVDIGAFHPFNHSNTYFFYKKGWHGINVEPNPDTFSEFEKYRKRDRNVNCGISKTPGEIAYYIFDEQELNTFSEETIAIRAKQGYPCRGQKKVNVITMEMLFDQYLPKDEKVIDLLSIDAEGLELNILLSNNWDKYIPKMIVIELLETNSENEQILAILKANKYVRRSILYNSSIFIRNDR